MKRYISLFLLVSMAGCGLVDSDDARILVRASNQTGLVFDEVILHVGGDQDKAHFDEVRPGTATSYIAVRHAFQDFVVHARAGGRPYSFQVTAVVAIPLDPGRYTYVLSINSEDQLLVDRQAAE